ncbi:MAG: hypothetical protein ACI89X_003810 [Planctomycetota bacterium]|jgi:hypothetical protein
MYIGGSLANVTTFNFGGVATTSIPIPNDLTLAGLQLAAQSVCLTLQDAFGLLTSNGIEATVSQ